MKTKGTLDWILYGKGTYVSALPVLVLSVIYDILDILVKRFVEKVDNLK